MAVVCLAPKRDVRDRRLATHAVRLEMMELHECPLIAPAPILADEGAASTIPKPHPAPDLCGDVSGSRPRAVAGPRPIRGRELLPGQVLEQERERPVDDLGRVAGRDGVAEEVLGHAELLAR